MPRKKFRIGNARGAAESEKLRRFEAEVVWTVPAGDAIKLERLVGAALREKHFSQHPVGAGMPRVRHDGAPKGAFGVLEAQLPSEQAATVEERLRPIGPLSNQGFPFGLNPSNAA